MSKAHYIRETTAPKRRRMPVGWRLRRELQWYSFILPTIICLVALTYVPMINGIRYSLYRVSVVGFGEKFIGRLRAKISMIVEDVANHSHAGIGLYVAFEYHRLFSENAVLALALISLKL